MSEAARILDVEPDAYHRLPGLSPSLAHVLIARCAAVARDQYERKLEQRAQDIEDAGDEPDESITPDKQKRLDRGTVLHALLLGKGERRLVVIPRSALGKGDKYTTVRSKELRDAARAVGKVPVKEPDMETYHRTVAAIRARLEAAGHVLDGISELAIGWWEPSAHGPVQCRTMLDHVVLVAADGAGVTGDLTAIMSSASVALRPTTAFVFEVKFPEDASPDRSERTSDGLGYYIAAAARLRALDALFPSIAGRIEYRYLFCEPHRPYAFWDPVPTGSFLELGLRYWRRAVAMWADGQRAGSWPGYHEDNGRRVIDLLRWRKLQEGFQPDEE